jgi:hypothetical protein
LLSVSLRTGHKRNSFIKHIARDAIFTAVKNL